MQSAHPAVRGWPEDSIRWRAFRLSHRGTVAPNGMLSVMPVAGRRGNADGIRI